MLLNSFSSYSSGSSDLSSVLGGVSVEELDKVKESNLSTKIKNTSYSSPQNAILDEILDVSGSGVLLACVATNYNNEPGTTVVLKVEIDNETVFYKYDTYSGTNDSSYILGLSTSAGMYFSFSSSAGQTYIPYDYYPNSGSYRRTANNFDVLDIMKDIAQTSSKTIYVLDVPVRFENNLKISASYYLSGSQEEDYVSIITRYILD